MKHVMASVLASIVLTVGSCASVAAMADPAIPSANPPAKQSAAPQAGAQPPTAQTVATQQPATSATGTQSMDTNAHPKDKPAEAPSTSRSLCSWMSCQVSSSCCVLLLAIVALILLVIAILLLIVVAQRISVRAISDLPTSFFFVLGMTYLVLLLGGGWIYADQHPAQPMLLAGFLPIAIPWFGALGAVTISLAGVFFHSDQGWDRKYNYWHIGRPLFGAVLGIVAFFMFVLIAATAGAQIPILEHPGSTVVKDRIVYYVLAFLVGYREETFRELIQRVTDLILKPNTTPAQPAVTFKLAGAIIRNLDFDTVVANVGKPLTVDIVNSGTQNLSSPNVSLGIGTKPEFTITANATTGVTELKVGQSLSVTVQFKPAATGSYTGSLVVSGSNLTSGASLQLTGKC